MKKALFLLFTAFFFQTESFAQNETNDNAVHKIENQRSVRTPDFSPPTTLTGPVFPPEDLIKPPDQETNRFLTEFINMMATLGLIVSVILIIAWFLKRMLNTRQEQVNVTSLIKVIERRSLSPKTAIYLLEIEGHSVIISESANGVTTLGSYKSPEDLEVDPKELPSAFNKILNSPSTNPP